MIFSRSPLAGGELMSVDFVTGYGIDTTLFAKRGASAAIARAMA